MKTTLVPSADVRRVLLVRPRFLGDICLALPTLDAIRAACPQARVAWVVERESAPLLEGDPRVDELIVARRSMSPVETVALIGRLRKFEPDVAIDLFCNPRTAQWCVLSGAAVRVGYPNKGWRSSLYTHHAHPRTLSAIGFHLASLEALGWGDAEAPWSSGRDVDLPSPEPRLYVSEVMIAEAGESLRELGVDPEAPLVGFHPGARWPTRRWAPANYAELAGAWLAAEPSGVALFSAGPGEERAALDLAERFGKRARAVTGWPLARFVALQSKCRAFVCGDTGPMHTAVAAGTATLGILSRNRPAMFFPYSEERGHRAYYARVECSPCDRDTCEDLRCLRRLSPAAAWDLLAGMLGLPAGGLLPVVPGKPGRGGGRSVAEVMR
jgi:ADP-heptose:LPS heptosyltransferase